MLNSVKVNEITNTKTVMELLSNKPARSLGGDEVVNVNQMFGPVVKNSSHLGARLQCCRRTYHRDMRGNLRWKELIISTRTYYFSTKHVCHSFIIKAVTVI